jgi:membrane-bound lytic murein transglycosylase B
MTTFRPSAPLVFDNAQQPSLNPSAPGSSVLRALLLGLGAALLVCGLSACGSSTGVVQPANVQSRRADQSATDNQANAPQRRCVGNYRAEQITGDFANYARLEQFVNQMAIKHGFEREYLMGLFSQAKRKDWTLNYLAKSDQTIKGKPAAGGWTRYRSQFLDERHVGAGVEFAKRHRAALQRASRQYGVPEEYILGILAVETTFGGFVGNHRVLDALTTLGFDYARRGDYFRGELENFLLMARSEGLDPAAPKGSFAGAMGLGQFMPSSFLKWAVDFNGDGRRDLWNPEDAVGSVANYFAQHGWQAGRPVVTPLQAKTAVTLETGINTRYTLAALQQAGLQPEIPCNDQSQLSLLLLRHQNSDQYLIGHPNFYAITRYNNSAYYSMAVHELAQTIKRRL